ncbi:polysaccharide biosynthesis tyrosine autokinase [uncultured Gelidibacter sp.]|uniref:GumC family protein n=1 Tax=uncultured Gelidibacter sp. TaxID=259318 RepID=UPI0026307B4A|nr:polysaccharide biosynthesis tyrosine autokinase [uncultured Gelidibacter sp.]
MNNPTPNKDLIREQFDKYLNNKNWFLISIVICFSLVFLYLRYATNQYTVKANIKIANDDKNKNPLSELNAVNTYGFFGKSFSKVDDEIQVIKSKTLMTEVVNKLQLNVQYFIKGKVKSLEIYKNPPLSISFLSNDSIVRHTNTSMVLNVKSKSEFTFENDSKTYNFGHKIKTSFGEIIITPNFEQKEMAVGKDIIIKLSDINQVTNYYKQKVEVVPADKESSVVSISLKDPVVAKAEDIINTLIDEYNGYVNDNKQQVVELTSEFINNRLLVISKELSEVDLTAETIKKDNKLTDLSSQANIFLQSEKEIENQQVNTATQLQLIDYMKGYLEKNNSNSDMIPANMSFEDNSINDLTRRHNELVAQRNRILKSSTENNPVIINLDQEINSLKTALSAGLSNSKSTNEIRLNALNRQDSKISSQLYAAPKKERQFRDLQRQQSIKESLYLYLLEKREEAAIANGISNPNAIIIDKAYASSVPVWPIKEILFLGALVLGFLIPLITIYISSILDTKLHNKQDVMDILSIPYLGDIPMSKGKSNVIKKVDYTPKAEAFRIIRSNIDFMLKGQNTNGKTIFVTSTTSQEGKSHTSINLAHSLSFSQKRVLLIETDIRVPKVEKYLKMDTRIGLTDYISDPSLRLEDVIIQVENNPYLNIILSGTIPPNPAELLMNERIRTVFEQVRDEYDYIIVDTAAVGLVTDTLLISKYADMVIYVISANNIDKRQLHIAQTMYNEKRLPNMTVLLNGTISKSGYGYGYGNDPNINRKKKWYEFRPF